MLAKAEFNYYPEEVVEQEYRETNRENNKKRAPKSKRKSKSLFKLVCFISVILLMLTSLFVLLRYANITQMRMDVTKLENQKVELEKIKGSLIADLEGAKSSYRISEDAMYKLGMTYPQEGQIVYVSVDDVVEETSNNIKMTNQLGRVMSIFSSLF